jgi:excinuclease ABC subunit A
MATKIRTKNQDSNPSLPADGIFIKGARTHNLKNVTVTIPRNKLVVVTGVSGSGKSSLTIDTFICRRPAQVC